ncbi:sigma-54-dependent Fis family transcriptional regulator [Clostridia bacterium]|nr:sigma-54-dependent Fis family transcriptional regulator [Clostridia bacterium]
MDSRDLIDFYKAIIDNYIGSILVTDNMGKVIFLNKYNDLTLPEGMLVGRNMSDLVAEGIYERSSTLQALKSKKAETDYIKRKDKAAIITTAVPILDEEGEIKYIVAYSENEELACELAKKIETEKKLTIQIANYLTDSLNDKAMLIYADEKMKRLVEYFRIISVSDSTVLLLGESGVGKDVAARYIHANSARKNNIFIPVNCASIPSELMESEFFGYVKGSFTGASALGKAGLFELADKGTLFLDEVGDLPLSMQSKLLRVLDTGEVKRIGGEKIKYVDVRIMAATNRDLKTMVRNGQFREDLYYRINVIPIVIPPIRDRRDDIPVLAEYFLKKLNIKYATEYTFGSEAMAYLLNYEWPGNVREIRNVVERMYITSNSQILYPGESMRVVGAGSAANPGVEDSDNEELPMKEAMKRFEAGLIKKSLNKNQQNISHAAEELGITRASLYKKMQALKISGR